MRNIFTKRVLEKFAKQVPELEKALFGVKMELRPNPAPPSQALMRSILYQQLAYPAAKAIHDRLLALVGELTPKTILAKSFEELKSVGLSRQKASYVQNVAEAFSKGGLLEEYDSVESLKDMSSNEIIELFVQIKGVGEWTVQMYLIFTLGKLDVLAPADLGVRKGVMKLYSLDEVPKPKHVKQIAEKWHPLETVGTYLAWRILETE